MRKILFSTVLFAIAEFSSPVRAQVPVIDSGQLAQSVAMLQTAGKHLQYLQQLVQLAQQFYSVVGQAGAIVGPFQSGGFGSVFGGGGFGLQGLASFGRFDPCQMGMCVGRSGGTAFTSVSYETARSWSNDAFFRPTSGSFEEGRQQLAIRQAASVGAAYDGLAVAITARQQIARSAERQTALEQAVASARDLRGDVQGATAVASALYQQERERTALLAALLQLSASRQIASDVRVSVSDGARGASAR